MPIINDTSPEADAIQIKMLQKASTVRRFTRARSLSSTVIQLSRRAIKRNRPGISDRAVKLEFISLHYGKALAEQVDRYLTDNYR
jgi:hypothetical protein